MDKRNGIRIVPSAVWPVHDVGLPLPDDLVEDRENHHGYKITRQGERESEPTFSPGIPAWRFVAIPAAAPSAASTTKPPKSSWNAMDTRLRGTSVRPLSHPENGIGNR
jgi:hypothetical protein